jgi:pimeloyl-ACP methyl ester carboxylesterase
VRSNAADVATALAGLAPEGAVVIGMSLGGLTAIALAAIAPRMVRALVLVDTVPGAKVARARHIVEAVEEWTTFNDFDAELARLLRAQPSRSASSVRRGMLNNAVRRDDGTWLWRWARHGAPDTSGLRHPSAASIHPELWEDLERIEVPVMLVRGMLPGSVLDEDNETDLRRRAPGARVVRVPSAGHSVHSDAPLDLAAQVGEFLTDNDLIER